MEMGDATGQIVQFPAVFKIRASNALGRRMFQEATLSSKYLRYPVNLNRLFLF